MINDVMQTIMLTMYVRAGQNYRILWFRPRMNVIQNNKNKLLFCLSGVVLMMGIVLQSSLFSGYLKHTLYFKSDCDDILKGDDRIIK